MLEKIFLKIKNSFKRHSCLFLFILNILVIGLLSLIIGSILSLSILTQDNLTSHQIEAKFYPLIRSLRKLSDIIYLPTYLMPSKLQTYEIAINPDDLEFLNKNLPEPYSDEILSNKYKKEVPAVLRYQGKEYDIEIRYRGQHSNHWSAPKKSWHIKIKDEELLNQKKEINLILPYDRYYATEQLGNYISKKLGVLTPESNFVKLKINNQMQGVYFEINGWTSEMIEKDNNLSGDSDIYAFDTVFLSQNALKNTNKWKKYIVNPLNQKGYENLNKLINIINYKDDTKFTQEISNILDLEKFYSWHISYLLMSTGHGNGPNLKLYFNKDTGKFEPIAWDIGQGAIKETVDQAFNKLSARMFVQPEFIKHRNQILWDYVKNDKNLKDDLKYFDKIYNKIKYDLYKDRLKIKSNLQVDFDSKQKRKQYIETYEHLQQALKNKNTFINIKTNLDQYNILAEIDLETENFSSLKFYGLEFGLKNPNIYQKFSLYNKNNYKIADFKYNSETKLFETNDFLEILTAQRSLEEQNIKILSTNFKYYIKSNSSVKNLKLKNINFQIRNYLSNKKADLKIKYFDEQMFADFEFINASAKEFVNKYLIFKYVNPKEVTLNSGSYYINKNIIIPKNLTLTIQPGAKLYFAPDISIFSYAKIIAKANFNNPIIFTASNKSKPWGVISLIGKETNNSIFDNCKFSYGSKDSINGIYFTGQLAVHNSEVIIINSEFSYAQADDSLNIKYGSESNVENNNFHNNSSDAIDFDWTNGQIKNNIFNNNLGDAIDLSGSQTFIVNNKIKNSGDKGISVGEKSGPIIFNNLITNNLIGIEIKDLSKAIIITNTILNNSIGVNAYQKKPIFGPGYVEVYNTIIQDNKEKIIEKNNSEIKIFENKDVSEILKKYNLN